MAIWRIHAGTSVRDSQVGSANAVPTADPDGDGQNNLLEYLAGTSPTSSASVSAMSIAKTGTNQRTVNFSPITAGRTYTLRDVTVKAKEIRFGLFYNGRLMTFSGTVEGDTMSGEIRATNFRERWSAKLRDREGH